MYLPARRFLPRQNVSSDLSALQLPPLDAFERGQLSSVVLRQRVGVERLLSGFFGTTVFCGPEMRDWGFVTHL